eukprot:symbB.v1.2.030859.t1/scaffold3521.1/size54890/4
MELCDDQSKKLIEELMAMPMSELKYKIKKKEDQINAAEKELKGFVKTLERRYDVAVQAQEAKQKSIKEGGLSLMKAVQAYNRKRGKDVDGKGQGSKVKKQGRSEL